MLKYFYYLYFQYEVEKDAEGMPVHSTFNLGYYSTKKKAIDKIAKYKNLVGFKEHPITCFKIVKQGIQFDMEIEDKSLVEIHELSHEYEDEEGYDYPTIFGIYSTKEKAQLELDKQKMKSPYKNYPNNFFISTIKVDSEITGWEEGFTSWDAD